MAEGSSRGSLKRPFMEDDDSGKPPAEKRARFPKGKKLKQGDYMKDGSVEDFISKKEARSAASDRAMRRNKMAANINDDDNDFVPDVRRAEVQYKEYGTFEQEGVEIEPFNLDKEREEGYFDENGNYVEYVNRNEMKDAWLDNVDVDPKYTGKISVAANDDEKPRELTTEDLAEINRRIADVLDPGETVFKALRRLKGNQTDKKQKMSPETKYLFDKLTEDAMKLMENGDYNVYEEKQESFEREAEGYERLARTRKQGVSESSIQDKPEDSFDMFADDDAGGAGNLTSNATGSVSVQPPESGDQQNDFVYDESSGYYYSSSLGYYYDPSSGLYCCAATGKWYSYNGELGTYDEVQQEC